MATKDFHHPFETYEIQQQFMEAVYNCIENGKVGIFESPTGTGKSLSLICGSLTWLREYRRKCFDEAIAALQLDDDEPEWMFEHARETRRKEARQMRADLEARLEVVRDREQKVRKHRADGEPPLKRRKQTSDEKPVLDVDDEEFVLDYESDNEKNHLSSVNVEYSSETAKLMEKVGMLRNGDQNRAAEEEHDELKIFFCSRTHSQLSQFVGELQRVRLPPGLPPDVNETTSTEPLKHLSLGSRKNLCINPEVLKLGSQTAINERCIELQQAKTPADKKCPFLPNKESEGLLLDFRDHALAKIRDIEDLAAVGTRLGICPYYASRPAIGPAEMVTLPYPLLLQKSAREALRISLKGHVVVIDEAHNLMNAIESIYSTEISETQLNRARESILVYLQKFRNRLKGSNRVYVTQLVRVIDSLLISVSKVKDVKAPGGTIEIRELLSGKGVDQIHLVKLVHYINESKLARKVDGYRGRLQQATDQDGKSRLATTSHDVPTLTHVQNFLLSLMNPSKEGRFFWAKAGDTIILRYLLLDPSEHFRDVVDNARAVILAGGTMSPIDDYKQQLFPHISSIETLSCGHLIPQDNLLVRTVAYDQDGPLEFSFKARSSSASATRIGRALQNLAPRVKGGLVVFFPSYGYLEQVTSCWGQESILEQLQATKPVYCDNRTGSSEDTFKSYRGSIELNARGAILLSVIGGKLSEGINFSDDLGRCVIVIGLPFPNLDTPEWKAKMQYIDQKAVARGEPRGKASREHAENVCMRSVNQAIGRVIRHKSDWASIILMDSRYDQDRIKGKLPAWIRASLPGQSSTATSYLGDISKDVSTFFEQKNNSKTIA